MLQTAYFQHQLSLSKNLQQSANLLLDYSLSQGFEHTLFQPQIGDLSPHRNVYQQLLGALGWRGYDAQQWMRFGFDQQANVILYISKQTKPFVFNVDEIEELWHKRRYFELVRSLFRRYDLRQGIIVPLHQSQNNIGYACLLTKRCLDLTPFAHQYRHELSSICSSFLEKTMELSNEENELNELCGLSQKEWECLHLAAQGLTEKEMAGRLTRSADTIKFHLRNAARKLAAKNRTQAVAIALKLGLIRS